MSIEKSAIANRYSKAQTATDNCLAKLADIRKRKRELALGLIKKSDSSKIAKVRSSIEGIK